MFWQFWFKMENKINFNGFYLIVMRSMTLLTRNLRVFDLSPVISRWIESSKWHLVFLECFIFVVFCLKGIGLREANNHMKGHKLMGYWTEIANVTHNRNDSNYHWDHHKQEFVCTLCSSSTDTLLNYCFHINAAWS